MTQRPDEEEGFLRRWSRRKQGTGAEPEGAAAPVAAEPVREAPAAPAELPPLESLEADSDYSAFLSPEVDEALRQMALRKLFHLPHLNIADGLDSDAEDFTSFAPLGETVTHEMRRMLEREAQRKTAAAEPPTQVAAEDGTDDLAASAEPTTSTDEDQHGV